jgi:outer membrane protein OmpA-like peptidoglycan-associated protein
MKKIYATPILLAIAALIGACSGMPTTTSLLDQARGDYMAAQSNPNIARYASLEMKQAGEAMEQANAAANDKDSAEKVDKLAYLAKQKIALTQEKASQKLSEAHVASAGKERSQMILNQRTNEADEAKASAERATAAAQRATMAAQLAQGETAEAQRKTRDAQAHATQLQAQLNDLAAKQTERGMVVTMGDVLFGTDIARLSPEGMRTAQKLADMLQQNPQRTVLVEGFTDSTGAASHNQELSERRATAVRSALQDMGISRERVAVRGFGHAYPVAANDTAPNRQLNRRVEIVISDASGKIAQR